MIVDVMFWKISIVKCMYTVGLTYLKITVCQQYRIFKLKEIDILWISNSSKYLSEIKYDKSQPTLLNTRKSALDVVFMDVRSINFISNIIFRCTLSIIRNYNLNYTFKVMILGKEYLQRIESSLCLPSTFVRIVFQMLISGINLSL